MDGPTSATAAAAETRERILDTAEALLRRFGPAKTTVVDVARALGMSHGNVYRHFASKAALQDAVAERWLHAISGPLGTIAADDRPAADRLLAWVNALADMKRAKVRNDPEMFATYHALAEGARAVVDAHVAELTGQLTRIIADGVRTGEFRVAQVDAAAMAVFAATARFHHPHHLSEDAGSPAADHLNTVLRLLIAGLRAGAI